MAGQPRDTAGSPVAVAGKTLARRQLDFALAAGCESVIALGDGGSAEAIALHHAAEAAGARFQAIRDSHGLLGAVRADDELLALAPGLLPEAAAALEALEKRRAVLVLPAGAGVAAGFERIDLERAWAGALVVGGAQVERLSQLPADIEPASALVRIALQAKVPEKRLPAALLAEGSWSVMADGAETAAGELAWLKRHLPPARPWRPTQWLAINALRPLASRFLAARAATEALALAAVALFAGAVLAAWYGLVPLGLALIPVGAILAQAASALTRLQRAPFGQQRGGRSPWVILPCLRDAALVACAAIAIGGSWLHALFPPLVLLGALHIKAAHRPDWTALPRDRGLLAVVLAVAAGFGLAEPAIMAVALVLIALNIAQSRGDGG
jgi:hypothetical protein